MHRFTFASDEAMDALNDKLPDTYHMVLNRSAMTTITQALNLAWNTGPTDLAEEAGSLLSCIAETLDIEFI